LAYDRVQLIGGFPKLAEEQPQKLARWQPHA
jgi:hypothetical protein